MNTVLIFSFTLMDSLCGCMQVFNLTHRKKFAAFLTSLLLSVFKIGAVLLVVKGQDISSFIAYALGGAVGAQLAFFRKP